MGLEVASGKVGAGLALVAMLTAVTGCGGGTEFESEVRPALRCVDDSVACITQRQAALRGMLADPKRGWVREPADANAYATGVRLFAFRTKKRELSCAELTIGRKEAEAGPATLRGPTAKHLTPAQISRGAMLSTEVSRELLGEMRRRCPA
jgi:hypothetical protein